MTSAIASRVATQWLRKKIALQEDSNMSLEDAKDFFENPVHPDDILPYKDVESFAEASFDEGETTFNLSDVRILYTSYLRKWIDAGRPDPKDPNNPIRPKDNPQIIAELRGYGLTWLPQGTKSAPARLVSEPIRPPGPNPQKPRPFDRRSLVKS